MLPMGIGLWELAREERLVKIGSIPIVSTIRGYVKQNKPTAVNKKGKCAADKPTYHHFWKNYWQTRIIVV